MNWSLRQFVVKDFKKVYHKSVKIPFKIYLKHKPT